MRLKLLGPPGPGKGTLKEIDGLGGIGEIQGRILAALGAE
jgi:hypothetical protein